MVCRVRSTATGIERLVLGLAGFQVVDAVAGLIPRKFVKAHLDHLGVPDYLQPALPVLKTASAAGLVIGLKVPRLGAVTAAGLVAYYVAAAEFHLLAGDHPSFAVPAAACAVCAAVILLRLYLPSAAQT